MNAEENQNQNNVTIVEPESEVKVQTELKPDDWLCLACHKKITEDKERFPYDGETEFHFTNPEGYTFDIITFRTAEGCREEGIPTSAFTWFKDHAWTYTFCSRCGLQLGWKYLSTEASAKADSFYGLIKSRLVKGLTLFN